ncbi:MAG: hypothetical protein MJA27_10265 [Pseudanabaenales cyanobacterium]|nr:hypothetical protein [Pseudanabaenales cyanobacterium]
MPDNKQFFNDLRNSPPNPRFNLKITSKPDLSVKQEVYIAILTWIEHISARWGLGCRVRGGVNAIENRYTLKPERSGWSRIQGSGANGQGASDL